MFPTIEQMNATARQYEREAMSLRAEREGRRLADEVAQHRPPRRIRLAIPALHLPRFGFRRVHA